MTNEDFLAMCKAVFKGHYTLTRWLKGYDMESLKLIPVNVVNPVCSVCGKKIKMARFQADKLRSTPKNMISKIKGIFCSRECEGVYNEWHDPRDGFVILAYPGAESNKSGLKEVRKNL
jgi:hypothetical protein